MGQAGFLYAVTTSCCTGTRGTQRFVLLFHAVLTSQLSVVSSSLLLLHTGRRVCSSSYYRLSTVTSSKLTLNIVATLLMSSGSSTSTRYL
uniref:Spliceosomal protein sap, putative n=1 Tax=Arundo donax TaxID=35708 RepID=A0A0A8YCA9_ARUDO